MSVEIYTGPTGSGKTSHAVSMIFEQLSYRRYNHVVANFGVNFSKRHIRKGYDKHFHSIGFKEMTPQLLMELSAKHGWYKKEGSTLLVIDEAGLKFNARDWQIAGADRMDWIDFFVNSRKLGFEPRLIAQNRKMVDRQIRDIIEFDVKHANLRNLWWFKWLPLPIFVTVRKWLVADFKPQVSFKLFNPFTAGRYDTMKLFNPKILKLIEEMEEMATVGAGEGEWGPTPDPTETITPVSQSPKIIRLIRSWLTPKELKEEVQSNE